MVVSAREDYCFSSRSDPTCRTSRRKGTLFGRLCFLAVAGMLATNSFATFLFARSSFANYPGGTALYAFNHLYASEEHGAIICVPTTP